MLPSTVELLRDILREAEFLETQAVQTTREAFLLDEVLKRAFVRSVEVIGEVAKQVPEETRSLLPVVEWRKRVRRGRATTFLLNLLELGRPHAYAARLDCYDGATRQLCTILLDNAQQRPALISRADVHQSDDSRMGCAPHGHQLPEVLVQCDENSTLVPGTCQDLFVAGILAPVASPCHVVFGCG
jgi:hypothetical protein